MSYKKIDVNELSLNPFKTIGKDWLLISAVKDGKINTMTASWGSVGVIWNKNVVTVYIRPQRYTKEFVDSADYFTLTFFDGYKKELGVLGSKSGRDSDKIREVGFNVEMINNSLYSNKAQWEWFVKNYIGVKLNQQGSLMFL